VQSFFDKRIDFETLMRHALMCDDELVRKIDIKQYYNGNLSPSFVKFDAVGLGVASRIKLIGPILEAFVRPRLLLDDDYELAFCFSIDHSRNDELKLVDFSKQFTRVPERFALVIDIEGRIAGKMSFLLMLFDRASKQLVRNWCDADFDPRIVLSAIPSKDCRSHQQQMASDCRND